MQCYEHRFPHHGSRQPGGMPTLLAVVSTVFLLIGCSDKLSPNLGMDAAADARVADSAGLSPDAPEADGALVTDAPQVGSGPATEVGHLAADIDPSGGVAETDTGAVKLELPAGALTTSVTITAAATDQFPADSDVVPGTAVHFGPDGLVFEKPVTATVAYDRSALPAGMAESSLRLYKALDGQWKLVQGSSVDPQRGVVTAQLNGFSTYAVRGACKPSCERCGTDNGCGGQCACAAGQICSDGICLSAGGGGCGGGGTPSGCIPSPEVCNDTLDNDCDGLVNEGCPVDDNPDNPAAPDVENFPAEIGSEGGVAETDAKTVRLEIPAQALASTTTITATPTDQFPADSDVVAGTAVHFGPDGLVFEKPVTVTVAYDRNALPAGMAESSLRLYKALDGQWKLVQGSSVDPQRAVVTAQLNGFSTYAVRGACKPSCERCGTDNRCGGQCACPAGYYCSDGICLSPGGGGCGGGGTPSGCIPSPEVCGDALDNDCDGQVDEGCGSQCACAAGQICSNGTCVSPGEVSGGGGGTPAG